jgi:G3E family GTPase
MEPVIVIVGFLGAGKTTLLKKLIKEFLVDKWKPFIVLNDYQNALLDSQQLLEFLDPSQVNALNGSCICCSGVNELRSQVNSIPKRDKGVTLIEANGTSDACALMGFLGVGLNEQFLPPIQISVVDTKNWQDRGLNNELEANQIQVSSLIVLNHTDGLESDRIERVKGDISFLNPTAKILLWDELITGDLLGLNPSKNKPQELDHKKTHWSSCSVDLPDPISSESLKHLLVKIPDSILRVKGCTKLDDNEYYSYFERVPSGDVTVRPYYGDLITGPKLLVIGPGSDPEYLNKLVGQGDLALN